MAEALLWYTLEVERRDTYLHAAVSTALDGVRASIAYIEAISRHFIRHDCSCLLIENYLDEPFDVWDAMVAAPRLGRHAHDCIKLAVVEKKAKPAGQRELKIHLSGDNLMIVRIFDTTDEAEAWFRE